MANSILKLRVESEEYDAKLKKAAEGIRHLADVAHKGGGELTGLEKAEMDYIRALGDMETKSRSAAGQVRELESTYKELKVVYDQLNEVEKADEGGKALAASLETLKQRAQDARAQMDAASQSLQTNASAGQEDSSALSMLADKFTINIDAIKLFNIGLQAAEGALSVAKDAFFASEATVDEWGRIMQSSQSLYEGFLNAINNGDISGFLSRMDEIVQAARAAYNELDTLGTMKTIQAPKMSAQQTENERLRMMIQTGRYIAPIDGRKASMKDGQLLTPEQIKTLERQLQNGMKSVVKLVGNEVKQTGKAINAYYNSIAKQNGMSLQEFKKGTSSWEEFSKKMQGYDDYKKWDKEARTEFAKQGGRGNVDFDKNNPFAEFRKWGTFRVDKMGENSFNDLVRLIQQRDQQAGQAYGMQSQAYRTMNRAEGVTVSKLMGRGGSGGGSKTKIQYTDDSIMAQEKLVSDLTQKWKTASAAMKDGYLVQLNAAKAKLDEMVNGPDLDKLFPDLSSQKYYTGTVSHGDALMQSIRADMGRENMAIDQTTLTSIMTMAIKEGLDTSEIDANGILERIFNGEDIPTDFWGGLMDRLNEALQDFGREAYDLDEKGNLKQRQRPEEKPVRQDNIIGKQLEKFNSDYSKVTGGVSSIVSGIQQMGVEIPQEIQSVLGVLTGISSIMTGIVALLTLIEVDTKTTAGASVFDAIIPMARGGIVPKAAGGRFIGGNSYSGDNIFAGNAWVNSGELVLNKAQQSTLASQLEGGGMQGMKLSAVISGEQIRLVLNNNGRRTGKGEYVQTNFR